MISTRAIIILVFIVVEGDAIIAKIKGIISFSAMDFYILISFTLS